VPRQISALGKVLAKQAVCILIGRALPGTAWIAKVDRQAGVNAQLDMLRHLSALIPCQGAKHLLRQGDDGGGDRVSDGLGTVPGQCRTILDARPAVVIHARQVQQ